MDQNWLDLLQETNQLSKVIETNKDTERYGLVLSEQDARAIVENRKKSLQEQKRVEFGEGITPKIIREFCDSEFVRQDNYADTIMRLQDEITDDELLHLMREQYDKLCFGNLDYLESTCLYDFAEAIRVGYRGYHNTDGYGEYDKFDVQERWSYELYKEALQELFWS